MQKRLAKEGAEREGAAKERRKRRYQMDQAKDNREKARGKKAKVGGGGE